MYSWANIYKIWVKERDQNVIFSQPPIKYKFHLDRNIKHFENSINEDLVVPNWGKGLLENKSEIKSHSVMPDSLQPHGLQSFWNSLGQNTEVGSLSLLRGIFPTQGSNSGLPHCRWILYQLSHKENPRK